MSQVLSGVEFCLAYLDDILVYSMSWKKHLEHLEIVFKCLREENLKIKLNRFQFFKKHLHYLGHLISEHCIQPLPEKLTAMQKLKEPSNIDELHHFCSLTGYYRKIIPLFTNVTKPLNKLLKEDTNFSSHHNVRQGTYTSVSKFRKPYILFTDANHHAYSRVLTLAVEGPEDWRPIVYTSG